MNYQLFERNNWPDEDTQTGGGQGSVNDNKNDSDDDKSDDDTGKQGTTSGGSTKNAQGTGNKTNNH